MTGFPLLLDLRGRAVLVVGGGVVGTRRARTLLDAGAEVTVVSPTVHPGLAVGEVTLSAREFAEDDLIGVWLVVACTDDPMANERVAAAAERRQVFCVRADDAGAGTARTAAVARHDGLTVAVNGGDDPRRAVALRDAILAALRAGELPTRRRRVPAAATTVGSVTLVGGGPGAPDLVTVRGRRLLAEADVVVVDRLAPRQLLEGLAADVEIVDSGKSAHRHNLTQAQINDVLVARAQAGRRVVRLKGGDPFVFGRGGEEWQACVAAGVPVSVVPGVSSALAAPALAGIPVTQRGLAAQFTVVSGHLDPGRAADDGMPALNWRQLAELDGTLLLLMAMDRLGGIADALISAGRDARTPAAVVHGAGLPDERVLRAPLGELAAAAAADGLGAPAVVVIGDVVEALPVG